MEVVTKEDLDWIGINATRLNAEFEKQIFVASAYKGVIHYPHEEIDERKRIVIGAGFEPGSSADLRAVQVANRFGTAVNE